MKNNISNTTDFFNKLLTFNIIWLYTIRVLIFTANFEFLAKKFYVLEIS